MITRRMKREFSEGRIFLRDGAGATQRLGYSLEDAPPDNENERQRIDIYRYIGMAEEADSSGSIEDVCVPWNPQSRFQVLDEKGEMRKTENVGECFRDENSVRGRE